MGWNPSLFSKSITNELFCPICSFVLKDAVVFCEKGHTLCLECARENRSNSTCCISGCLLLPVLVPNIPIRTMVQKLFVSCPHAEQGCTWAGPQSQVKDHHYICTERCPHNCPLEEKVQCTYHGCDTRTTLSKMYIHQLQCTHRPPKTIPTPLNKNPLEFTGLLANHILPCTNQIVQWKEDVMWEDDTPQTAADQTNLGLCYEHGIGVEEDGLFAIRLYQKASKQQYAPAMTNLGNCYLYGWYGIRDVPQAIRLLKAAATQNYVPAQCTFAAYLIRVGQYKEAIHWYQQEVSKQYAPMQADLAFMYLQGYGVDKDLEKARTLFHASASQGWAIAQTNLGKMYLRGIGGLPSKAQALYWFTRASIQGHPEAQFYLAINMEPTQGISSWIHEAAQRNHIPSIKQLLLEEEYHHEAVHHMIRVAHQGNLEIQCILGEFYQQINQPRDAFRWISQAARGGYPFSQYLLGRIYEERENQAEAIYWYNLAAEQDISLAQHALFSLRHAEGRTREAHQWLDAGADQGEILCLNLLCQGPDLDTILELFQDT